MGGAGACGVRARRGGAGRGLTCPTSRGRCSPPGADPVDAPSFSAICPRLLAESRSLAWASRKGQGVVPRRRAGYASSRYDSRRRPRACGLGDAAGPRGGRALRSPGPSARRDRAVEPRGRRSPVFRPPRTLTASVASLPPPPPAMASAAREGAGSGRRRPPPRWALPGLLLLCLWLPGGRAAGSPSAPLSELHAQLSGVEQLLEEFRRQLQQERPQEELELELRAGGDPQEGCPGPGGGGYRARPDAIIRTKDSIAAGASFLSAPAAVRDWRQCLQACCLEPHCPLAVVELPRRSAPPAAALGCYLFNCTWRGRSVCKFALHRGYSSYSLSRAPEGEQEGLEAGAPALARASPRLEKDESPLSKAGQDVVLHLPTDGVILDAQESTDDHAIVQYEWTLLQGDPTVDMKMLILFPIMSPSILSPEMVSHGVRFKEKLIKRSLSPVILVKALSPCRPG